MLITSSSYVFFVLMYDDINLSQSWLPLCSPLFLGATDTHFFHFNCRRAYGKYGTRRTDRHVDCHDFVQEDYSYPSMCTLGHEEVLHIISTSRLY